jgi:cytochrome c
MKDKSVGPSYMAIAERYKEDKATIKKLAAKVISGGAGVWGEFAMSAHPQLSIQQASDIVSYVLSVKDKTDQNNTVPASPVL